MPLVFAGSEVCRADIATIKISRWRAEYLDGQGVSPGLAPNKTQATETIMRSLEAARYDTTRGLVEAQASLDLLFEDEAERMQPMFLMRTRIATRSKDCHTS